MISLQPQEFYTIVRQLPDPSDSTTYYVQAVVRRSVDDTILEIVKLTDLGSRRFKKAYQVPADVGGLGFYIDITTTVYTDSDYTVKSTTYSEELESYLVFDRIVRPGGGGGGTDVDYKKIQKMLDGVIKAFPVFKGQDLNPMLQALGELRSEIMSIKMPEIEKVDFTPVLSQLATSEKVIVNAIEQKEVTETTDISPILEALDSKKEVDLTPITQQITDLTKKVDTFIDEEKASKNEQETLSSKIAQKIAPILNGTENIVEDPLKKRAERML